MPEGPEVKCVADTLNALYAGKLMLKIAIDERSRYWFEGRSDIKPTQMRIIQQFHQGMQQLNAQLPLRILQVRSRGKKIIFELDGGSYLVSSLAMEGRWIPVSHDTKGMSKGNHSNLWIDVGKKMEKLAIIEETLYFDDSRHFGSLEFCFGKKDLDQRLSDLGPDLLQDEITKEKWLSIFRNPRLKNKQVCDLLLEQDRIAGIGNYLRAEILYRAKIRPNRTLGELTDADVELLREHSIATIKESYSQGGCTIKTYWDPLGRKGNFKCVVYGEKKDPFGNEVRTDTFKDGRTTHWVPAVQV